ncbi:MAG: TspO/MBR family protein [Alphaproteobacteria bacterium]
MKKYIAPVLWIVGFQLVGGGLGFLTSRNIEPWYDGLNKAALNPPDYVFGLVWPILYVMLALTGWLMWRDRRLEGAHMPLNLYWMQMFFNWGWTFIFFEFKLVLLGFFWILTLNFTMLCFIIYAWKNHRVAALLALPTLFWGCFAAYLNYAIWVLN